MKKLKLKPAVRDKRRYFIAQASNKKIEEAILKYIGVLGFAKSAYMKVSDKKFSNKITVGSCKRESLNDVKAALAMAKINIQKVSNTLKGLSK